jgi:hypothetical protein
MEQTNSRGRAAIVHLTKQGALVEKQLRKDAQRREQRFVATLSPAEHDCAVALIHKLIGNVPAMNKE